MVDFYCPATILVIEIDGDSHYTHSAKVNDFVRQQFIESLGLNVLRFTNEEIYKI